MSDEKSEAQQKKESRIKKIEDDVKKVYTDKFNEHQKEAKANRVDEADNAETEEEYRERIANVPGLFSDSYAYGVNQEQVDDLKEEANEASDDKDSDSDDDDASGSDVGGDPDVAKAAAKTSPASDTTKPATALENQKTAAKKDEAKK